MGRDVRYGQFSRFGHSKIYFVLFCQVEHCSYLEDARKSNTHTYVFEISFWWISRQHCSKLDLRKLLCENVWVSSRAFDFDLISFTHLC